MTQSNVHHFCNFYIFLSFFHSLTMEPHLNLFKTPRMSILSQSPPVSWRMVRVPVTHNPLLMSFQETGKCDSKNPSNFPLWKFWQCKLCQDQSKNNKRGKHNTEVRCPRGAVHHGASWAGQQCHQQIFHQWCPKNFSAQLLLHHANHDPKCCWCFLLIWSQLECEWKRYTNLNISGFGVSGLPLLRNSCKHR